MGLLALTTGMATYLTLICYDFIYCGWPIYPGGQGLFMYRSIFPDGRAMWSRSIFPDGLLCTYHGRPIFPGNQLYRSHYGWPIYPGGRDQTMSLCRQDETPLPFIFYKFVILGYFIQDSTVTKKEYNLVSFCIFVNYYIHKPWYFCLGCRTTK